MKILFFGTPDIAVPYLEWLINHEDVVGVVTRSDEPKGRGHNIQPPPIKTIALANNIPVFQPVGSWTEPTIDALKNTDADVGVAVAYGRLLPKSVYSIPKLGTFNIHFSLLPKYRGAGPIQWALINGETETGVTAFWIEEGMDSGPICYQKSLPIQSDDQAESLKRKLIPLGVEVLGNVMADLKQGKVTRDVQTGQVILAPQLKKEKGVIKWGSPAQSIVNLIRGVYEWPGATTYFQPKLGDPKQIKIFSAQVLSQDTGKKPGTLVDIKKDEGFVVQAQPGVVLIREVQPEGKKRMPAWAFWQGAHLQLGDQLG